MSILAISMPGTTELILIIVLVMMFFGVGKLPEVGAAIGRSIKNFKDAQKGDALDVTRDAPNKGALPDAREAEELHTPENERSSVRR